MDGVGAANVGDPGLGEAEKPSLALSDEIADHARHVLHWHGGIDAMLIEKVDMVGLQPTERALRRRPDRRRPAVPLRADLAAALDTEAELGGDHDFVTPAFQRPA